MISKPLLAPKTGYIETIDENGNHVYKPTAKTTADINAKQAAADSDALLVDHEYRLTLIELGVM